MREPSANRICNRSAVMLHFLGYALFSRLRFIFAVMLHFRGYASSHEFHALLSHSFGRMGLETGNAESVNLRNGDGMYITVGFEH